MEILRGRKKKCLGQFLNSLEKAASNPQKVKESFLLTQKNNSAKPKYTNTESDGKTVYGKLVSFTCLYDATGGV